MATKSVGVDGCKGGWVACVLDDAHARSVWFEVYPDLSSLWRSHGDAALVLVDIPIGLPERGVRSCDLAAKRILGRYNSRVFLTPPRRVLGCEGYPEANVLCRELADGRGLMKQLWAIAPKICEADALLLSEPSARGVLRECHPEICIWGLRGQMLQENKRTPEGAAARLALLNAHLTGLGDKISTYVSQHSKKVLGLDDVVDAALAALTARLCLDHPERARTLPVHPDVDGKGLSIEMVYFEG